MGCNPISQLHDWVEQHMDVGYVTVPAYHCILAQSVTIHVQLRECLSTVFMWTFFWFFFFFAYHLVGLIASMQRRERKPAHHKENKQHSNNLPRKSHLNSWLKGNLYAQYRHGREAVLEVLPSSLITSVIKLPYLKLGYISWTLKCLYLLKGGSRDSGLGARGEKLERGCSR